MTAPPEPPVPSAALDNPYAPPRAPLELRIRNTFMDAVITWMAFTPARLGVDHDQWMVLVRGNPFWIYAYSGFGHVLSAVLMIRTTVTQASRVTARGQSAW